MDSMTHGTGVIMIKRIGLMMMLTGQETTIIIKCTLPGKKRKISHPMLQTITKEYCSICMCFHTPLQEGRL